MKPKRFISININLSLQEQMTVKLRFGIRSAVFVWLLSSNMSQESLTSSSQTRTLFSPAVWMEQSALMTLSSTKVSENSDLMRNASLHVLKSMSQRISFSPVRSILMRYFRGMFKQEIFCKLSEVTHRQFHVSRWQAIS